MPTIKKQEIAQQNIMKACKCEGFGCKFCAKKVEHINTISRAGIPVSYWDYNLDTFFGNVEFKKLIEEYVKNIDGIFNSGKSIIFMGNLGVGKTFAGIELLKAASYKKYSILYTAMSEIIDMLLNRETKYNFKSLLLDSDFLMIDELDSRHMPSSDYAKEIFGENLEYIIRSRIQNKLPIIFCTNNSDLNMFEGYFKYVFDSLLSKNNLIKIPVAGLDLRKTEI